MKIFFLTISKIKPASCILHIKYISNTSYNLKLHEIHWKVTCYVPSNSSEVGALSSMFVTCPHSLKYVLS